MTDASAHRQVSQSYQITLLQALITEVNGYVGELRRSDSRHPIRVLARWGAELPVEARGLHLSAGRGRASFDQTLRQRPSVYDAAHGTRWRAGIRRFSCLIALQPFWRKKQFIELKQADTESGAACHRETPSCPLQGEFLGNQNGSCTA
jgi:hypothetical protein